MNIIVAFLLGAYLILLYQTYWNRKEQDMGQLPQLVVQKIGNEWFVSNLVRGLAPVDRERVIELLLEEIDSLDHGTKYDLDA